MKNYVVSMIGETERRQHTTEQFSNAQVEFEFFDAITAETVTCAASDLGIDISDSILTKGELGCLLSHATILQRLIDGDESHAAIFEDDVYLSKNASMFLSDSSWIGGDVDLIKVELFKERVIGGYKDISLGSGYGMFELLGVHLGTAGYIVSKDMAIKILNELRTAKHLLPIDNVIFYNMVLSGKYNCYQMNPALSVQDDVLNCETVKFSSAISEKRTGKDEKRKLIIKNSRVPNTLKIKAMKSLRKIIGRKLSFVA